MLLNSWRTKCRKNCMLTHTLLRRISTTKTKTISRSVPSPYFMSMATFFTPSLKISSLEWTIKIWFPFLKDFNILLKVKLCDEVSPVTVGQRLTLQFISRCTLLLYRHLLRNGLWKEVWTIVWIYSNPRGVKHSCQRFCENSENRLWHYFHEKKSTLDIWQDSEYLFESRIRQFTCCLPFTVYLSCHIYANNFHV